MNYKPGDVVWWARFDANREQRRPCRVCFGNRRVVLTLGNGDEVTIECHYCGKGYSVPTGEESVYSAVAAAEQKTITEVRTKSTATGDVREYLSGGYWLEPEDVFPTEAEAKSRADQLAAAATAEEEARAINGWRYATKSFAWKAGYHLRNAEKARRDLAYSERMAVVAKAKAKPKSLQRFGIEL